MGIYNSKKQKIQCGGNLKTLAYEIKKLQPKLKKFQKNDENIPSNKLGSFDAFQKTHMSHKPIYTHLFPESYCK